MFFPGSGGKPHKAKNYCADCPFFKGCLEEAAMNNLQGFWCGLTDAERAIWASQHRIMRQSNDPDYGTRKPILTVVQTKEMHSWMDEVEPSVEELQRLEQIVG